MRRGRIDNQEGVKFETSIQISLYWRILNIDDMDVIIRKAHDIKSSFSQEGGRIRYTTKAENR